MPRRIELDFAIAGLALARNWLTGDPARVERILAEISRLGAAPMDDWFDAPERTATEGYREWSETYDSPGNPVVQLEQAAVEPILAGIEPGVALDAACGTGRHAARLAELGHRVIGVDASEEMLGRARARLPEGDFRLGDLEDLPVESGTAGLSTCALALTHLPNPTKAIAELARAVRPGGRVVISDVHPVFVALGAQGFYGAGYIRNHVHWHGTYLEAFREAGLHVRGCHDIPYGTEEIDLWAERQTVAREIVDEALEGLPAILVWDLERQ